MNAPAALTDYVWDEDNRLVQAEPVTGEINFTYNALGQRVKKATPTEALNFLYDAQRLLEETDDAGDLEGLYTATEEEYGDLVSEYVGIEVKSGTATRTAQQRQVDANLQKAGGLDTVGQRAADAGIDRITSVEVITVP
ncbi:MAG TPA: hypothetical protein VFE24_07195 [Pirellulales bacterium]|nr:hypothetical protein [Pirellulales bacterium]